MRKQLHPFTSKPSAPLLCGKCDKPASEHERIYEPNDEHSRVSETKAAEIS
jgi:hypothetical protein